MKKNKLELKNVSRKEVLRSFEQSPVGRTCLFFLILVKLISGCSADPHDIPSSDPIGFFPSKPVVVSGDTLGSLPAPPLGGVTDAYLQHLLWYYRATIARGGLFDASYLQDYKIYKDDLDDFIGKNGNAYKKNKEALANAIIKNIWNAQREQKETFPPLSGEAMQLEINRLLIILDEMQANAGNGSLRHEIILMRKEMGSFVRDDKINEFEGLSVLKDLLVKATYLINKWGSEEDKAEALPPKDKPDVAAPKPKEKEAAPGGNLNKKAQEVLEGDSLEVGMSL